jgi:hypothetical protein
LARRLSEVLSRQLGSVARVVYGRVLAELVDSDA